MSIMDTTWDTPFDPDLDEYFGMCDECSAVIGYGKTEDELIGLAIEAGWICASTDGGDTGVLACPKHKIEQALRWYGIPEIAH